MPNGLVIAGGIYPIETDFRAALYFWRMARENRVSWPELLHLFFPGRQPDDPGETARALRCYLLRREDIDGAPTEKETPPAYDFLRDGPCLLGEFQRRYGMDLSDPALRLHWWRFMALLEAMVEPDFPERVYLRTADLRDMEPTARQRLMALRRAYAIGPRRETLKEHLAHLDEIIARGKEHDDGGRQHTH